MTATGGALPVVAAIGTTHPYGTSGLLVELTALRTLGVRPVAVVAGVRAQAAARVWGTTRRETDVLRALVSGDANKEIAQALQLHEGSVERHVTAILRKAGCDSRARLVATFWTQL